MRCFQNRWSDWDYAGEEDPSCPDCDELYGAIEHVKEFFQEIVEQSFGFKAFNEETFENALLELDGLFDLKEPVVNASHYIQLQAKPSPSKYFCFIPDSFENEDLDEKQH